MSYEIHDKLARVMRSNEALKAQVASMAEELRELRQNKPPAAAPGDWIKLADAAPIAEVDRETLRLWIHQGRLMARKVGHVWRVNRASLNALIGAAE